MASGPAFSKMLAKPTWDGALFQVESGRIHLFSLEVNNLAAVDYWLQCFDAAVADVTLGVTAPNQAYLVPAGNGALQAQLEKLFNTPPTFTKGCCMAVTTTPNGATVPGGKTFVSSFTYRRPLQGQV